MNSGFYVVAEVRNHRRNSTLQTMAGLLCATLFMMGDGAFAQTFSTLHSFAFDEGTSSLGLTLINQMLYGTEEYGSSGSVGGLFSIGTGGAGFTNWYLFPQPDFSTSTNLTGYYPEAGMIADGGVLYGTTSAGGAGNAGTVFRVLAGATNVMVLHHFTAMNPVDFTNGDGATPMASVILSGGMLYGTTHYGGSSGYGVIFQVDTNGNNFSVVHQFLGGTAGTDGANPQAGLVLSGGTLYGTTFYGGTGYGAVYSINTNRTGFKILYNFDGANNGAYPEGGLVAIGNTLYGTTYRGGDFGNGLVYSIDTSGQNFSGVHSFAAVVPDVTNGGFTNYDGMNPASSLTMVNGNLYGTAQSGGSANNGTIYEVTPDGSTFSVLYSFSATESGSATNLDGASPRGPLISSGNMLYGTTQLGGEVGAGTIYRLNLSGSTAELTIHSSTSGPVLSWSTAFDGFTLQSVTDLPANVWSNVTTAPVVDNGFNVVTDRMDSARKFYRLQK